MKYALSGIVLLLYLLPLVCFSQDPNQKYNIGDTYHYYAKNDYYDKHPIAYWLRMKIVNPNDPNPRN